MDRYKFRGKRLDNGEWVYGFGVWQLDSVNGSPECWMYTPNGIVVVDPTTVGQYTGLKYHTQRKESYEGDIVEYAGRLCIVKWDSRNAEYYLDSIENTHDQYSAECINDSTYNGNIHDNPELLEGKG